MVPYRAHALLLRIVLNRVRSLISFQATLIGKGIRSRIRYPHAPTNWLAVSRPILTSGMHLSQDEYRIHLPSWQQESIGSFVLSWVFLILCDFKALS